MPSTLVTLIEGACSPARFEPELSINLEICEMINKKQGTAPREAASTIVKLVNSKNINQAMLALTLLDNCVKNCGYPFHLQIATKEFLNELVKKFPERPAPFPNPVTQRILYLIKEWKVALADMSKHKDDLVHIKDMYRLLRFKGYRFPELKDASIAALAPSESLKSAHELEEEDRLAQSAKLQELIRRGRPQDLVEANRLMKIMSGYDTRQVPDYSQKFEDELHKVQEKAILLYEMLETVKPGDNIERNDTIVDLKSACASAQPKIQKLITEEEDNDKIENLLTLNDMINNVMAKYADIRKGLFDTHYEISGKPPSANTHSGEEPKQAISLIDLDDDNTGNGQSTGTGQSTNVLNELSDIFGSNVAISPPINNNHNNTMVDIFGSTTAAANSTINNNDLFDILGGSQSTSNNSIASPSLHNVNVSPQQAASPVLNQGKIETATLVNKNGLHIELDIKQVDTKYYIKAYFSNLSTAPMDRLMLRLAAPKSMQIKMEPQSSQTLAPKSTRSVTQNIVINNTNKENLRLRYKVSYEQFGVDMELAGDFHA
ncbi:Putative ADP-ribosylation factor-binding protein GGA2 [Rhizopus microsporus]|nr:Putative ADP-ribosylation factor-binding protein GGA2 [Rhizopus microsporus]